ncbi:hypothetical protein YB2330_000690 [Saitoella coloradoensis]
MADTSHEEAICRVCRSESTPEDPLYHPCKCSGTIRYVHQDCLEQWLAHSGKDYCELCKTKFKFSKMYARDMPNRLPLLQILLKGGQHTVLGLFWVARTIVVTCMWFGVWPFAVGLTWLMLFKREYSWASGIPFLVSDLDTLPPTNNTTAAAAVESATKQDTDYVSVNWLGIVLQGYVIIISLVVSCLAIFLLREWIAQYQHIAAAREGAEAADNNAVAAAPAQAQAGAMIRQLVEVDLAAGEGGQMGAMLPEELRATLREQIAILQAQRDAALVEQGNGNGNLFEVPAAQRGEDGDNEIEDDEWVDEVDDDEDDDEGDAQMLIREMTAREARAAAREARRIGLNPEDAEIQHRLQGGMDRVEAAAQVQANQVEDAIERTMPTGPASTVPAAAPNQGFFDYINDALNEPPAPDHDHPEDDPLIPPEDEEEGFEGILEFLGFTDAFVNVIQNVFLALVFSSALLCFGVFIPAAVGDLVMRKWKAPVDALEAVGKLLWVPVKGLLNPLKTVETAREVGKSVGAFVARHVPFEAGFKTRVEDTLIKGMAHFVSSKTATNGTEPGGFVVAAAPVAISLSRRILAGYGVAFAIGFGYLSLPFQRLLRRFIPRGGPQVDIIDQTNAVLISLRNVLKVFVILSIELIFFPVYSGILVDLATILALGPEVTLMSRWQFAVANPWTSGFLHWFSGTVYMFQIATFLSMTRSVLRTGVLYFIRDPNDTSFSPFQEIATKPFLAQLRKIGISSMIYLIWIFICLGSALTITRFCVPGVLPLHLLEASPVFEIPLDMIAWFIFVPFAMQYVVYPAPVFKGVWKWWYRQLASYLRLSSFMFNGRYPEEERDGSKLFLRVPVKDNVPVKKGVRMLVPVTEDNRRLDSTGKDKEDKTRTDERYQVVYVPPYFWTRIFFWFVGLWAFGTVLGLGLGAAPLIVGRVMLAKILPADAPVPSDIYAVTLGLVPLGSLASAVVAYHANEKDVTKALASPGFFIRGLGRVARLLFVMFTLVIVVPTAYALVYELYFAAPLRWFVAGKTEINFGMSWATAFVLYHTFVAMKYFVWENETQYARDVRDIVSDGWLRPNVRNAMLLLVLPSLGLCATLVILPLPIIILGERTMLRESSPEDITKAYRLCYPISFLNWMLIKGAFFLKGKFDVWQLKVKDEIYSVGTQLHNMDAEEREAASAADAATDATVTQ